MALALLQTAAVTTTHGLVVLTGNLALILVVALTWGWEVVAEKNDFSPESIRCAGGGLRLSRFLLLAPANAGPMTPDFGPVRLLNNGAGLTFCMMTPVVLAVLTLFHPR